MFRKLFALLAVLSAFACGGTPEDVNDDGVNIDQQEEIGQTEEAINIGNGGYGFTNATAQLRCAQPGVSGQVCFVPNTASKTIGYCFAAGNFTSAQESRIDAGFAAVDAQTNWTFLKVGFPCDISIQNGTVSGGTTNIENFAKMTPTGTLVPLTSPAGTGHVNGTWTGFTKLSVVVDQLKIDGFGGSLPTTYSRYVGGAIAARYLGNGSQSLSDAASLASFTRRAMPANSGSLLTSGEVCRSNNYALATQGQISAVFGCGI